MSGPHSQLLTKQSEDSFAETESASSSKMLIHHCGVVGGPKLHRNQPFKQMNKRKAEELPRVKEIPKPTSLLKLVAKNFGADKNLDGDKSYAKTLRTIQRKFHDSGVHRYGEPGDAKADVLKLKFQAEASRIAPKKNF